MADAVRGTIVSVSLTYLGNNASLGPLNNPVTVDGNVVTISAEVKSEKEEKGNGDRVLRRERQEGFASRSFTLACPVDEAKVEASYKDGILALTLPKKADTSSKRIAIH